MIDVIAPAPPIIITVVDQLHLAVVRKQYLINPQRRLLLCIPNLTSIGQCASMPFPNGTVINEKPAPEILYPDFVPRTLPSGKRRAPDVTVEDGWVLAGGGTSLFDRPGVFTTKGWLSFDIPKGTVIPDSLVIRFTGRNDALQAGHYQIESRANRMRIEAYKGALDNLARNAVVRFIELANGRQAR